MWQQQKSVSFFKINMTPLKRLEKESQQPNLKCHTPANNALCTVSAQTHVTILVDLNIQLHTLSSHITNYDP